MHLTKGERKVLWYFALIVIGFMPPVLNIVNRVTPIVLGLPFILFWAGFMVVMTTLIMTIAYNIRAKEDGEDR